MGQGLNTLDIILAVLLVIGLGHGLLRGFVWQVIRLVGLIVGILLARAFYSPLATMIHDYLYDFGSSINVAISYILIFGAVVGVCALLARFTKGLVEKIELSGFDRLIGGLFGIFKVGVYSFLFILLIQAWVLPDTEPGDVGAPPEEGTISATVLEQVRTSKLLPVYDWSAAIVKPGLPQPLVNKWNKVVQWTQDQKSPDELKGDGDPPAVPTEGVGE